MPRKRPNEGTVAFARLRLKHGQEPFRGAAAALEESLVAGTEVTRYDRVWHMDQHSRENGWIYGRIGFEKPGQTELWDRKSQTFVPTELRTGQTSPFAINLETLKVAFQLRSGLIKPGTFRSNFQALLNEAAPHWGWIVRLEGVQQPPWEEWREGVNRLLRLEVRMKRPNPRYPGDELEDLFERSKANAAKLILDAPEGESLDPEGPEIVRQAIELAQEHGDYTATGEVTTPQGETVKDTWRSSLEGQVVQGRVPADPNTGEARPESLRESLELRDDDGDSS